MSSSHSVRLPYPDRTEPTVATCDGCDWTHVYGWGQHGEAVDAGGEHIRAAAGAEPVEIGTLGGYRRLMPGRSL